MRLSNRVYLDASRLLAGDVILTSSKDSGSVAVRLDSGPGFSHAILVRGATLWYEADLAGLGPTYVSVAKCESTVDYEAWLVDISRYRRLLVFRHASVIADPTVGESLGEVFDRFFQEYDGRTYPKLTRLAAASRLARRAPRLVRTILSLADRLAFRGRDRILSGVSCSELVTRFYDSAGLSLFDPPREPSTVTPNDIASSSVLREIPDVLRVPDARIPNDNEALRELNGIIRFTGSGRHFARRWTDLTQAMKRSEPFLEEYEKARAKRGSSGDLPNNRLHLAAGAEGDRTSND